MKTIAVAGAFDTKGKEFLYVKGLIEQLGMKAFTINTGVFEPYFKPDVNNDEVAAAAGYDIKQIVERRDRAMATEALSKGMEAIVPKLYEEGKFDGIMSLAGSGGTSMVTPAMRALPIGVPKLMVSTMASGNVAQYVGSSDIIMMPSLLDVAGLNKISRMIFKNAVMAMAGMVGLGERFAPEELEDKPLIAATMFGVTTPCVDKAKEYLENHGYEVLVFHCTGTGGKVMESLIDAGYFTGVLDITTTEWVNELCEGVLTAGPDRCGAAIRNKIPQVVSVGATDMVTFGPYDTVPEKFRFSDRNLYKHNPTITIMRTTEEECSRIGEALSDKWNGAQTEMKVLLPVKGVSMVDAEGQPFDDPAARQVLNDTLKEKIDNPLVTIEELDYHINDAEFAEYAAKCLVELLEKKEN